MVIQYLWFTQLNQDVGYQSIIIIIYRVSAVLDGVNDNDIIQLFLEKTSHQNETNILKSLQKKIKPRGSRANPALLPDGERSCNIQQGFCCDSYLKFRENEKGKWEIGHVGEHTSKYSCINYRHAQLNS